jgi:hypothetical protein
MEKNQGDLITSFVTMANQLKEFIQQQNSLFSADPNAALSKFFGGKQNDPDATSLLSSTIVGLQSSLTQFDRNLSQLKSSSLNELKLTEEASRIPSIKEMKPPSKGCVLDIAPPKKHSKQSTKSTMTSIEIKKDFLGSILQLINMQRLVLDQNVYRKLVHHTFDLLPYMSQKISYRSTHEEFYVEVLTLIWQLINFSETNLTFPEVQYPMGVPSIVPFRYGAEGSLKKPSASSKTSKKNVSKGAFCFFEDDIHAEATRLAKKIHTSANGHLSIQEAEANNDTGKDQEVPSDINFLYKALKRKLTIKTVQYKTSFLSFLIGQVLEKPALSEEALKSRAIRNTIFETEGQRSAISEWEGQMIRMCRFLS